MKICLAISTMSSGGAERNTSMLANHFSKDNDVFILTLQSNNKSFYKIDKKVKIIDLDLIKNTKNFFSKLINLIKRIYIITLQLKKQKPDILISFLETTNITLIISSLFISSIKVRIVSDRNNPKKSERPIIITILKFLFYRFSDYVVLQTQKIKENYKFVKKNKIKIIQNTISDNIKLKKNYKINKKLKIISVGRLEPQKGYDVLLKSLKVLKENNYEFLCNIFGAGSERKKIYKSITKLGLKNYVFLKGVNNKILNYYKNYNLYILSSKFEGYPNSLLEALASGLTSISSDCDYGPSEIITNNVNGLLFKNGNHLDLYKKINFLLKNKSKFNKFGKNSKKKFQNILFNNDKLIKWEKLIKKK